MVTEKNIRRGTRRRIKRNRIETQRKEKEKEEGQPEIQRWVAEQHFPCISDQIEFGLLALVTPQELRCGKHL